MDEFKKEMTMPLMPDPKLRDSLSNLSITFSPIYDAWRTKQTPSEALKLPANCNECLAGDIMALGQTIARFDRKSQGNELNFLAEILAFFQQGSNFTPYEATLSAIDKQVNSAMSAGSPLINDSPQWPPLLTVNIVKEWVKDDPSRLATGNRITAALVDLLNRFVIRDGVVSDKELKLLSGFEKHVAL